MFGDERESVRSPITSRSVPTSRATDRSYQQRLSVTEDNERDDNEYEEPSNDLDEQPRNDRPPPPPQEQYISALRYRFPNRPKNDYSYSKPIGPANVPPPPPAPPAPSTTQSSSSTATGTGTGGGGTTANTAAQINGPYQTTSRPTINRTGNLDVSGDRTFPIPPLRRVTPDEQNTYAKRVTTDSPATTPQIKTPTTGQHVRFNDGNNVADRPTPTRFPAQSNISREQESTFESVPSHGPVSYLGTGTFSQFERCLRECLERERRQTGIISQITRQDIPSSNVINEYGYDPCGVTSSSARPLLHSTSSQYCSDYLSGAAGAFTINDIRHINVALSRSGISLFPYERPIRRDSNPCVTSIPCTYSSDQHRTGDVVSACRVVEDDPALLYNNRGY